MDVNIGRLKKWDWGVGIAFLLTIFGVSFFWWRDKLGSAIGDALNGLGDVLGGLPGGIPAYDRVSALGWDIDAGVAAFCFALFAVLFVAAKIFLPANKPLPKWYMESWVVLVFGGIVTLCGFVGCVNAPYGGFDMWAWWPGSLITLLAGIGMLYCGYMMLKDKSGEYGEAAVPKINIVGAGGQTPSAGGSSKFCVGCGTPLDAGATACKSCGRPA